MVEVKVCGLTSVDDAARCVDLGVDALGLNFWAGSPRSTDIATARHIVREVGGGVQTVGVFVNASLTEIREILDETGIEWAQLHGDEPPELVEALLPRAYKAIGVGDRSAIALARSFPGAHLLLDARVPGLPGGTGRTFDWTIAEVIARERTLTLAGGLSPQNVAIAVRTVRPFRVDVASGVESSPGRKDPELVRAFVQAAQNTS